MTHTVVNRGVLHGFMHETIHELQQYAVGRSMVDHGMAYMMSNHGLDHGLVHGLSTYLVPVIVDHSGVIRTRGHTHNDNDGFGNDLFPLSINRRISWRSHSPR